jgi:hypothetical protein
MSAKTMAERWAAWWRVTRVQNRDEYADAMHEQAGADVHITAQQCTIAFADGSVFIERWTPPDSFEDLFEPAAAPPAKPAAECICSPLIAAMQHVGITGHHPRCPLFTPARHEDL